MRNIAPQDNSELEALEQREWRESLDYVIQQGDRERVHRLLSSLRDHARAAGVSLPFTADHAVHQHDSRRRADAAPGQPGNRAAHQEPRPLERDGDGRARQPRLRRHRRPHLHLCLGRDAVRSRLQSFLPGQGQRTRGDIIYFQGHASPGIYARAFLEGRIPVEKLDNFRRELAPGGGLSSYPHPWLMPDFWEYPTVSMGLGPIMAIYQARFNRYLEDRGLKTAVRRRRSGRFSATARPTSRSRSAPSASPRAKSSTT